MSVCGEQGNEVFEIVKLLSLFPATTSTNFQEMSFFGKHRLATIHKLWNRDLGFSTKYISSDKETTRRWKR